MSQLDEVKTTGTISTQVNNIDTNTEATIDIDAQFFTPDGITPITASSNPIAAIANAGVIATDAGNVPLSDIEEAANRRLSIIHENAMTEKAKLDAETEEAEIESSTSDEDVEETVSNLIPVPKSPVKEYQELDEDDADLLADLGLNDTDETDGEDIEEELENAKSEAELDEERRVLVEEVKSKLLPGLPDVSSIQVVGTPVTASTLTAGKHKSVRDWPMVSARKVVQLAGLDGTDIDVIYNNIDKMSNSVHSLNAIARVIYDAIRNQNKPEYIDWLKLTLWDDFSNLLNGLYFPTFDGSNFLPATCAEKKCNHTFLTDNLNIDGMVDFPSDEVKKEFFAVLAENDTDLTTQIPEKRHAISQTVAVGIRPMTVYAVFFEPSVIGDKLRDKFLQDGTLNLLQALSNIYAIQPNGLHPLDYKRVVGNEGKTLKYRYAAFHKAIKTLSSEEINYSKSLLKDIMSPKDTLKFKVPEQTCPKCGATIPESTETGLTLLLERHQLTLTLSL